MYEMQYGNEGLSDKTIEECKETKYIKEKLDELCDRLKIVDISEKTCELIKDLKQLLNDKEIISNEKISEAARNGIVICLSNGYIDDTVKLIKFLENNIENYNKNDLYSAEVLEAAQKELVYRISNGYIDDAEKIIQFLKNFKNFDKKDLSTDKILEAVRKELADCLLNGYINDAERLIQFLEKNIDNFDKNDLISDETLKAAQTGISRCLSSNPYTIYRNIDDTKKIIQYLENNFKDFSKNELLEATRNALAKYIAGNRLDYLKDFIQALKINLNININELFSGEEVFHSTLVALSNCKHNSEYEKEEYHNGILNSYFKDKLKITNKHLNLVSDRKYLDLCSIQKALEESIEIFKTKNNERKVNYKELHPYLLKYNKEWQDEQINEPFMRGLELFGYDLMFEYINNSNCSLHDKMIGFNTICDLCEKLCITPKERKKLFNNILIQVKDDNSSYNEGTSYHHLNAIVNDLLNINVNIILQGARELENSIPNIKELVNSFISDTNNNEFDISKITSSWKNLKRFIKLKEIVDDKKFHLKLEEIRKNNPPLYKYVTPLLFHKDSNVDKDKVWLFINDPEKFFSMGGSSVGPNYGDYNLNAVELRQAIVEGKLDEIQEIRPMEIEYIVRERSTLEYLRIALGERSKNTLGKASSPKTIYNMVGNTLESKDTEQGSNQRKKSYTKLTKVLNGESVLSKEEEEQVLKILMLDHNMKKLIESETEVYRAQIHKKSDPLATVVGDDTACCMPFGSEKGMVYFFTPNNAIFSIQKKQTNGEYRTIAQSVVTLDINSGIAELNLPNDITIIPDEAFKKMYLTCDNVEVAPNFKDKKSIETIEEVYRVFFGAYQKKYAESMGVDNEEIIIGPGFGDALTGLKTRLNTYYTTSELTYSDNLHKYSYILNTKEELHPNLDIIETSRVESEPHKSKKLGEYVIENISPSDILRIAKAENDIYGGLKQGIDEMQKMIEAYLIKNTITGKQGFMFKMKRNGEIASYMIATENNYGDVKEVNISNYASKRENSLLNTFMIREFIERYKNQYGSEETLPAIKADFRGKTSYKFVEDIAKLNMLLKRFGMKAKVEENCTEDRGGEIFHKSIIFLLRLNEDDTKFDELKDIYEKAHY